MSPGALLCRLGPGWRDPGDKEQLRARATVTVTLLAALALVAAACSGEGNETTAATSTTTSSTTTTTDPTEGEERVAGWPRCENPEAGYTVAHPPEWQVDHGGVVAPCTVFDPGPVELEEGTEIPFDVAVAMRVDDVDFATAAAETSDDVRSREASTVDRRDAVRIESVSTGEGLGPAGITSLRWLVDLDGATLVASTHDVGDVAFADKVDVLDQMVSSLSLDPPGDEDPPDEGPEPIGRPGIVDVEAGGFPAGGTDTALLSDVRVGAHDGFDRVVLEFAGDTVPSYRVGYIDSPVREDGSGNVVDVAGSSTLALRMSPASGVDLSDGEVEPTYDGPMRLPATGTEVVRELVRIGDFEGQLAWAVGVEEPVPFAVTVLEDPVRIVVDLVPEDGT